MEFASDGTLFVGEQSGIIRRFATLTSPSTEYADLSDEVLDHGSRGLMGLAIDPSYPASANVYAFYDLDQSLSSATIPAYDDSRDLPCGSRARVMRMSGATSATTQTVLLDGWCQLPRSTPSPTSRSAPTARSTCRLGDAAMQRYADTGQQDDPCGDPPGEGGSPRA